MSNLADYYAFRDNFAHNCWQCDRTRGCKCSRVEKRAAKRSAKHRHRMEIANEIGEPTMEDVYWRIVGAIEYDELFARIAEQERPTADSTFLDEKPERAAVIVATEER